MKKTRYKACLLISELDDDMILEAELANVPMRRRVGHVMKRVWLIAACMTLLATATILLLLPAMLREYPVPSPIPPLTSEPAVETPEPVVNWVSDPTLVRVERLSASEAVADPDVTEDGNLVSVESQTQYFANQLILIHFSCREDEHVIVEPSSWRSALNPVYPVDCSS